MATGVATAAAPATAAARTDRQLTAGRYLVTFADEPAASYEGTVKGYARTRPDAGKKLDPTRTEVVRWRQHLTAVHDSALQRVGATKVADYTVATNGVAAELTAAQATALAKSSGVTALEPDALRQADTTYSPEYLRLSEPGGLWSQLGGQNAAGTGVIVGVIDTGIWPESPSFAGGALKRDKAGQPVASTGLRGRWFGDCVQGELFDSQDCNDKLIGARYYVAGFGKQNVAKEDYLSPRDGEGHGSHTASTAAGNKVEGVQIDGHPMGTASGMAPGADVAAYKVCWTAKPGASGGCFNSDSVSAIDDAVADGVDVLNYSIGGSSESSPFDVVEMAFRRAANLGVFVAASAGNNGPGASTLDHPSPWLTTTAASTFRLAEHVVELGDGQRFVGASTTGTMPTQTRLVRSTTVALAGADPEEAARCFAGTLDPALAAGKVVQCDRGVNARIDKSFEVKRAGGVAMVLTNRTPNSLNGDFHAVPTVHVSNTARAAILAYITSAGTAATAAIVAVNAGESSTQVPEVTTFSSRGPSTTTGGDLLKPDIAAPGNDVLAAVAPPFNHGRSFDYYSGTSMASPHIAGIGALVKAKHPTWSASRVKSALMTTARDHATNADPFAQGAGFVQPNKAVDPGLVFDATATEWRRYLVGLGVHFAAPFDTLTPLDGSQLNQASVAIGALAGRETVTRTVTNVSGSSETYTVTSAVPGMDITASPSTFTVAPGASQAVDLEVVRDDAPLGEWAKGNVTFTSSSHVVRVPLVAKPVAISAPAEISGSDASGSTQYSVTPGFTGTLTTTVAGLVGAAPVTDSVVNGAYSPTPSAATKAYELVVPAGTTVARFDVDAASAADDLDLYVYKGGTLVGQSASAAGDEQVTLTDPEAGTYTAYVNGYDTATGGGGYAYTQWAVPGTDALNLTVTGGGLVTLGTPVTLTASWNAVDVTKRWFGFIGYGGATERTLVSIG
ncbi:MAG TPA: S8 family serine peptidase [Mycobacteriales bacterium]|nr:S8 family serine peptidase [Mycobacteriales bacterium]